MALFPVASIRATLARLLVVCVVPGLVGAGVLIDYLYRRERAALEENLLQTTRALAQAVERELTIARTATEIIAGGPFFASGDLPVAYRRANDLVAMGVANTVVLADQDGRQVFNILKPLGAPLPTYGNSEHLRQVFATGRTVTSDMFTGAVSRQPLVAVGVPVWRQGRVEYLLAAGLMTERFNAILTEQHLPPGQIAAILDSAGTFVARSQLGDKFVGRKTTPVILKFMATATAGVIETETTEGIPSYVALSRMPGSGWWVGIAAPKSELLGQMRNVIVFIGLGTALLVAAGIAYARVLGRRISSSVNALVAPALALGAGRPAAAPRLPIRETDAVAQALNAASELVRQRTEQRDRAFEHLRLAEAVFNNAQETIVVTDLQCMILTVNPAFSLVTEYAAAEAVGRHMSFVQSGCHDRSFYQQMWQSILTSGGWQGAIWNRRKSGDIYQEWLVISTVRDGRGEPVQYVGISIDMARMNHVETRMEYLAHHDALTGLPNRLLLHSRLEHSLERARRDGARCAVVFIDLDRFKPVNDTWGHAAGDELLQLAAGRLKERLRDVDTLARVGGDEFLVVLDSTPGPEEAAAVAEELVGRLAAPFVLRGGQVVGIGGCAGIALFPCHGRTARELVAHADIALYQAKSDGRGAWRIFQAL